jgi:hypothetical protein
LALGEERFYGLALHRFLFSDFKQLKQRPLVWLNGLLRRPLTPSRDHFVTGVINPNSPAELQLADFDPHIKQRLALQHSKLEAAGFQFVGCYNGPSVGLAKNIGELWVDGRVACLNLLIQSIAMRREKKVAAYQSLFSWRDNGPRLVTTNVNQELGEDPTVEYTSLPQADLTELIHAHHERIAATTDLGLVDRESVWWRMYEMVKQELQNLQKKGLLQPVSPQQLSTLVDLSQFIDFRDRTVPAWVRWPLSLQLPVLLWAGILVSVVVDRPKFAWGLVFLPVWWLLVLIVSAPVFRHWMAPDPQDNLPPRDFFHYLRTAPRQS